MTRYWRCVWVLVVLLVTVQGTVLQCGIHCTCRDEVRPYRHDFMAECNASTMPQATITEEILDHNMTNIASPWAIVSVEGGESLNLNVSLAFLQRCRQFSTCNLAVNGAKHVVFPPVVPKVKQELKDQQYFGIQLTDVSTNEVPAGIFNGKSAAGLTLQNTTVGVLPAGLFSGVPALYRLHILDSVVGVMEGPMADAALYTKMWSPENEPVKLVQSTVGLLGSEALRLRMESHQSAVLQGVSLGRVDSGAVQVQGGRELVVEQCVAARVEAGAVVVQGRKTHLELQDNWLALQPGALTQLPCGGDTHHMDDNHFSVVHNGVTTHVTLTTNQTAAPPGAPREEELAERERLTAILSTVIHPSCISFSPLPTAAPLTVWSEFTLGRMVMLGVTGLLVGLLLGGLILHCYVSWSRRRRSRQPRFEQPLGVQPLGVQNLGAQPVIMTQIPEDPIYEECGEPPAVPPFPCRSECSTSCAANGGEKKAVENHYMVMRGQ